MQSHARAAPCFAAAVSATGRPVGADRRKNNGKWGKQMIRHNARLWLAGASGLAVAIAGAPAFATQAAPPDGAGQAETVQEIIVTAQKRAESVNTVPMSITAVSGETLKAQGVTSTNDLAKIIPGFTYTQAAYGSPVYSLRGVGFYDYSIGAAPAVSVYVDEAPLPFSTMSRGAAFDLERVEVLKGPQGTLFGSNSTGGAVNYIAAKPTRDFEAGGELSYGSFDDAVESGYLSGPLGDNAAGRIALRHESSGDWQTSTTRDDQLGAKDFTQGRAILDWSPNERFKAQLSLSGFLDRSDAQAAQLVQIDPLLPPFVSPGLATQPIAASARAADWTPGAHPAHNDTQAQGVLRLDYKLNEALRLTSLTSFAHYTQDDLVDPDGTSLRLADTRDSGHINSVFQELRLSGEHGANTRYILGVNYEHDHVYEAQYLNASDASGFRSFGAIFGIPTPDTTPLFSDQVFKTYAVFANLDHDLGEQFTVHGAIRYTRSDVDFQGYTGDSANGSLATALSIILSAPGRPVAFNHDGPTTLGPDLLPAISYQTLKQDNVSWRIGLDYKPWSGMLIYGNISKGYKGGSFPTLPATSTEQYRPVTQEGLLAYELGFKAALLEHRLQLNGALFYYDYSDKQIQGSIVLTPNIFGPLNDLVNIPKSRVEGAELQAVLTPVRGLNLSLGGTYLDTAIGDFTNFGPYGAVQNFKDESFPNTPKWQIVADAEYTFALSERMNAFFGGDVTYHSRANSALGDFAALEIRSYTLLDLRAGLAAPDDSWRLSVWGRNVTDQYYWTNAYKIADVTARFAAMPATIGVTLSGRFR